MITSRKSHLFISYSRSDRLAVDQLVRDLRRQHYVLWMDVDERGIEPGEDWRAELIKQMSEAEGVIACGSPDFLGSPFCQEEIAQAKREGKPIYPVLVRRLNSGQTLGEIGLDNLQYVDLTQGYNEAFRRLTLVLPRPRFPLSLLLEYIVRSAVVLAGLALLIGAIALAVRAVNPPAAQPTATIAPTPMDPLEGFPLKVVVVPFTPDTALSEHDQSVAKNFATQLSNSMARDIKNLNLQSDFQIGFLGSNEVAPLSGTTELALQASARILAGVNYFDMVVYGIVKKNQNGLLQLDPHLYIPAERFTDALEMTGSQAFGASIVLPDTNLDTAFEKNVELKARVEALVDVVQGVSHYIAHEYPKALESFEAAAAVKNWNNGREILNVLQGNVHLQMAREAVTACLPDIVLQQLDLADQQYQQAASTDSQGRAQQARPYAALAETAMIRSYWSQVDKADPCNPQVADSAELNQALKYSDLAIGAKDYVGLDSGLVAEVLFTKERAQASLWYTLDEQDPQFQSLVQEISGTTDDVISLYQKYPDYIVLARTAFEAYALRGAIRIDAFGAQSCARDAIDDFKAALDIANPPPTTAGQISTANPIQDSRKMFLLGFLGQCYELNNRTDEAVTEYQAAYDIAKSLNNGNQDVDFYACKLQTLSANTDPASTPCAES